jgi:hypothetical protein
VVNAQASTDEPYKLELILAPPGGPIPTTRAEIYEDGDRWDKLQEQLRNDAADAG